MRAWLALGTLLLGCGNTDHHAAQGSGGGANGTGGADGAGAGGAAEAREIVLAPQDELLPECDTTSLELTGADGTENWQSDRLLFPTSWRTFRGYAMRGPIDALTGIWSTGNDSQPFQDRELRPLSSALIPSGGKLLCAAGTRRALRNGSYAALELDGLGPLACTGDVVPGELRYAPARTSGSRTKSIASTLPPATPTTSRPPTSPSPTFATPTPASPAQPPRPRAPASTNSSPAKIGDAIVDTIT